MTNQPAIDHILSFLELVDEYEGRTWTSEEFLVLQEWALEADTFREELAVEERLALDGMLLATGLVKPELYQSAFPMQERADRKPVAQFSKPFGVEFVPYEEGDDR